MVRDKDVRDLRNKYWKSCVLTGESFWKCLTRDGGVKVAGNLCGVDGKAEGAVWGKMCVCDSLRWVVYCMWIVEA